MKKLDTPADLVCIARAAYRQGDRQLLRDARRVLREKFGIKILFTQEETREEPADA